MFTTIEMFEKSWKSESNFSRNIMNSLTDESLAQAINNDHRTLGRIAWHIVQTIPEMMSRTGLKLSEMTDPVPTSAKVIQDHYDSAASSLLSQVKENWKDETLQVEDEMYGEQWKKGATLYILINHEIHHRGQMTVLLRQAGIVFPDMYGPTKEGWKIYGAEPPKV